MVQPRPIKVLLLGAFGRSGVAQAAVCAVLMVSAVPLAAQDQAAKIVQQPLSTAASLAPASEVESFVGRVPRRLGLTQIAELRAFLRASMDQLGVPGAAFALIDHGKVVASEGLGVTDLGNPSPVTDRTLFMLGSNTKGMTTLLQAKLVDEGRVGWNTPVTRIYPGFRFGDAENSTKVEFRHLACMCTGLPAREIEWILGTDGKTDPAVTFRMLAASKPTEKFGDVFQYNNATVAAAGFIAGHLLHPRLPLDKAYKLAMRQKVLGPLGMTSTTFDLDQVTDRDHARPHGLDLAGKPAPGTYIGDYRALMPAGSAWSNVRDMIKYVRNELDRGHARDGRELFGEANMLLRRHHVVPSGPGEYYGMGLSTKNYGGVEVVHHGGSTPGFISQFSVLPDAQIGAVLLTNSDQGRALTAAFERRLIELVYDARPQAVADVTIFAQSAAAMVAKKKAGLGLPPSDAAANKLVAHYTSLGVGKIDVRKMGQHVFFNFGAFECRIAEVDAPDGLAGFACVDPASFEAVFVPGTRVGRPILTVRDARNEYIYVGN